MQENSAQTLVETQPSNLSSEIANLKDIPESEVMYINNFWDKASGRQMLYSECSFLQTKSEEDEAIQLVKECMGVDYDAKPRVCGAQILVRIHKREYLVNQKGQKTELIAAETVTEEDKYRSAVGLVVAIGPKAYNGNRFNIGGAHCKVGDFVVFPLHAGEKLNYRGHHMRILYDDNIKACIQDPNDISFEY